MFIRKTTRKYKDKIYENYLLVESYSTPNGPRQKTICSLGSLKPAPASDWLIIANKVETALAGQMTLEEINDPMVQEILEKIHESKKRSQRKKGLACHESDKDEEVIKVVTSKVTTEDNREAGPVHVGAQFWNKLGLNCILEEIGFSERARILTLAMTMNRLIHPSSEYAMPDWINRSSLGDIIGADFSTLAEDSLYRNLDRLHEKREIIEKKLWGNEKTLFNLDDTIYLYDCTSTYFEGQCSDNPQAQRGYSRDNRPDCKQVVVGLVVNREGFPIAHEIFDGNRTDTTTMEDMLTALEKRCGKKNGATVVVDRGMSFDKNLETIKSFGYHYIVASRKGERDEWLDDFECGQGWKEVKRTSSPRNPFQKKSTVKVKTSEDGDELYVLCVSDDRIQKDRAIREKQEHRLLRDIQKLSARIEKGRVKTEAKIYEAIGRLKERYSRVARYYEITCDTETMKLRWEEKTEKKEIAQKLDGSYILKTDRKDLCDEDIWRVYSLLTRAESAFRSMKSPLAERPIFHQLQNRVQTHIFLCLLAYHLLVAIEKTFLDKGIHTSWATIREELKTHQVNTIVLHTPTGDILKIRKGSTPEPRHNEIYEILGITSKIMKPIKTWFLNDNTKI